MNDIKSFTLGVLNKLNIQFTPSKDNEGIYSIDIPSSYKAHFNNQSNIHFTFDKDIYKDYDNVELAIEGSYFIDRLTNIVNSETYLLIQFIKPILNFEFSQISIIGNNTVQEKDQSNIYMPIYEFRIKLDCSSDERIIRYFSIFFNNKGELIDEYKLNGINQFEWQNTQDKNFIIRKQHMDPKTIEDLYMHAAKEVQRVINIELANFEKESNARLIDELDKLKALSSNNSTQVDGIKEKFAVKVNVEPVGLFIRFSPYQKESYRIFNNIRQKSYSLSKYTKLWVSEGDTFKCNSCDRVTTEITVCEKGDHLACSNCILVCSRCHKTGCEFHNLDYCEMCRSVLCSDCVIECVECKSKLCDEHSFKCFKTGKILCEKHTQKCSFCNRHYHHTLVHRCQECDELICEDCTTKCASCDTWMCTNHAYLCETTKQHLCKEHIQRCAVCGKYHRSDLLKKCAECGQYVCNSCSMICSHCGSVICKAHSYECVESNQIYCSKHFVECIDCGKGIGIDIAAKCNDCGNYVCNDCISTCQCGKSHCSTHTFKCVVTGSKICKECGTKCATCYKCISKEVAFKCEACGVYICPDHHITCKVSEKILCKSHSYKCEECSNWFSKEYVDSCKHNKGNFHGEDKQGYKLLIPSNSGKWVLQKIFPSVKNTTHSKTYSCEHVICHDCKTECSTCHVWLCSKHKYMCETTQGYYCIDHIDVCKECGKLFSKESLNTCSECGANLCKTCTITCECGKSLCKDHKFNCTVTGNVLCKLCSSTCENHDHHLVSKKISAKCGCCDKSICKDHATECRICGKSNCSEHISNCDICREKICDNDKGKCSICGQYYCANCINSKRICTTCNDLLLNKNLDSFVDLFRYVPKLPLIYHFNNIKKSASSNARFVILKARLISTKIFVFDTEGNLLNVKTLKKGDY